MVTEYNEHRFFEQVIALECRFERVERLVEEGHGVEIVAKRRLLERSKPQHLVPVRKIGERMMERQRDEPGAKRLRKALEPGDHLLKEVAVVQPPADLLGHLEVGLEQALLEAVRRVHDTAIPETRLERDGR